MIDENYINNIYVEDDESNLYARVGLCVIYMSYSVPTDSNYIQEY